MVRIKMTPRLSVVFHTLSWAPWRGVIRRLSGVELLNMFHIIKTHDAGRKKTDSTLPPCMHACMHPSVWSSNDHKEGYLVVPLVVEQDLPVLGFVSFWSSSIHRGEHASSKCWAMQTTYLTINLNNVIKSNQNQLSTLSFMKPPTFCLYFGCPRIYLEHWPCVVVPASVWISFVASIYSIITG